MNEKLSNTSNSRQSMTRIGQSLPDLPYRAVQQLITEIAGKAPEGIEPAVHLNGTHRQLLGLSTLAAGLAGSYGLLHAPAMVALAGMPATWLLTSAALRTFQVSFTHYASHGTLVKTPWLNRILGEAYSVVALYMPLWMYKIGHLKGHHSALNSEKDPDGPHHASGFIPGQSIARYWAELARKLASPVTYGRRITQRLLSNFLPYQAVSDQTVFPRNALPGRRYMTLRALAALGFHGGLLGLALALGELSFYAIGWLAPLLLGFSALAELQDLTEHQPVEVPGQSNALRGDTRFTAGRFFGYDYDGKAPLRWWMKMLFLAYPQKLLLVGCTELQSHDLHHDPKRVIFELSDSDWAMAPYHRTEVQAKYGVEYKENWGARKVIEHSFRAWQASDTE